MNPAKVQFGEFELDRAGYELSRSGRPIKLERIPMELLMFLVDRRGQLVTRDEILERLWGRETHLDANNSINTAISKIRVALRDDPENPAFIRTVSGKGYRFIGPIEDRPESDVAPDAAPAPPESHPARWRWFAVAGGTLVVALIAWSQGGRLRRIFSPSPVIHSLAVLPLENLTGDESQDYFADGMTDALITDLAQIKRLRVISRTSVMRFKHSRTPLPDIAKQLDVDGVVEGSVMRSGGRVRITSQLIYAPHEQHLWAQSYVRDDRDIVNLQSDVAEAIVAELRTVVSPEERARLAARPSTTREAYEDYLKGRYVWNQRTAAGVEKSIEFFRQAVERDPNFALAYAGLADAYNFTTILGTRSPEQSAPAAKAAALRALALNPRLAEAHAALGIVMSHYDFDFPGAQREFLRAIELNPSDSAAHLFYAGAYLTPMGRHQEAIAEMKKALEVDPLSTPLNNMMGQTYLWAGDDARAFDQYQRTIALDPRFPLAHLYFVRVLEDMGRYEEAIMERQRAELLIGAAPEEATRHAAELQTALRASGPRGYWHQRLEDALASYERPGGGYVAAMTVAGAFARAGDRQQAFQWLEKSYRAREDLTLLRSLPEFKSLRGDPRFVTLLARMGLPH